MHTIILARETDFDGWRKAARALALNDVKPSDVTWAVRGNAPEPAEPLLPEPPRGTFNVSAKFVELAKAAILHRNGERFALLYRLLWRLRGDHDLLTRARSGSGASHRDGKRRASRPAKDANFHPLP
jgi:DNA polymerase